MPKLHESVYVAPGARVLGDVSIQKDSSVWYNAVIRGDAAPVSIGESSNIQDGCILHVDKGFPLVIGNNVSVGHGAILHGCRVEDRCVIGMGAVLLDGAYIEADCIIGAGTLVTQGIRIPAGSVAFGNPVKVVRPLREDEKERILANSREYVRLSRAEALSEKEENT